MKKTNAERQRSYRERKRNARNAPKTKIGVTARERREDYYDEEGNQHIFLCQGNGEPLYAMVVNPAKK